MFTGNIIRYPRYILAISLISLGACQPETAPPETISPQTISLATSTLTQEIAVISPAPDIQTDTNLAIDETARTDSANNDENTASTENTDASGDISDSNSPEEEIAVTALAITPAPKTPAPPAIPPFTPASQSGKKADDLIAAIGEADLIREEGQIEIWQYHQPDCVVDFYFPIDTADSARRILSWDMRPRIYGGKLDIQTCEAQLADRASS